MCDHVRTNNNKKNFHYWFVNPPKIENEDVDLFSESLSETVVIKVRELNNRLEKVDDIYKKRISDINKKSRLNIYNETDEYLYTMLAEIKFNEKNYILKWLEYWIGIYEIISKKQLIFRPKYENEENMGVDQEEVERAKLVPIENLMDGDVFDRGNRMVACCPFHGEKTPSFTIFKEDNHFWCFGCGVGGDSIDFLMKKKNLNLIEAVKELNRG